MKRRCLSLFLTVCLLATVLSVSAYASTGTFENGNQSFNYTVYSKGDIDFEKSNVQIYGNAVVDGGALKNLNWSDRIFNGKFYLINGAFAQMKNQNDWSDSNKNAYVTSAAPSVQFNLLTLPDFPTFTEKTSMNTDSVWGQTYVINESGWYSSIYVGYNQPLTIQVNPGEVLNIRVDKLEVNGVIKLTGDEHGNVGKVVFYVDDFTANTNSRINDGGNSSNVSLYFSGAKDSVSLGQPTGNMNVYAKNTELNIGGGTITGNVYSDGKPVELSHMAKIKGLLYAPNSNVTVSDGTGDMITGCAIVGGLQMDKGNSRFVNGSFSDLEAIPENEPPEDPSEQPEPLPDRDTVFLEFPYAYLYGYETGPVGADEPIKKEEAVAILYRLLKQNDKLEGYVKPLASDYPDIQPDYWAFSAIEFMRYIGVFTTDNIPIKPCSTITRGDMARIIVYTLGLKTDASKTMNYTDVDKHYIYYNYIKALDDAGILNGYSDNTFRPDDTLTRAEYVKIINRLTGRGENYIISNVAEIYPNLMNPETSTFFPDLTPSHWAYKEIMRATLGFSEDSATGNYVIDPSRRPDRSTIDYN